MKANSEQFSPRRPDYKVKIKLGERTAVVGAAWKEEDGRISVRFNPFVTIPVEDPNLICSLFPADKKGDTK